MRFVAIVLLLAAAACQASGDEWRVTSASWNSAHPTWCGGNIIFHSDRVSGVYQIWGTVEGGERGESRAWRVTNNPCRTFLEPSWNCELHFVYFHGHHGAGPDTIWSTHDSGTNPLLPGLTFGNSDEESPCLGPPQPGPNRIVCSTNRWGPRDIVSMPQAGESGGFTRLTTNAADDVYPAVSPDGLWIAFSSDRAGSFDIWVMSYAGEEEDSLRHVTSGPEDDLEPAWSPGGTHLAFGRSGSGIVVVDLASRTEFQATTSPGDASPAWSPEGDVLAFTRPGAHDTIWCTDNLPPGTPVERRTWGSIKALYR